MRVLRTLTGSAAHLPARNAYDAREPFPVCTPVGTAVSNGITRFYFHTADAVTCKRCLRALAKAHAEALAMHEAESAAAAERAKLAELCGRCGSPRSSLRHGSPEGHAFVDHAEMDAELDAAAEVQAVPAATREDVVAATGDPVGWVSSMLDAASVAEPPEAASPLVYTLHGEPVRVLGTGERFGEVGVWALQEGKAERLAFFVGEDQLVSQFSAYRPGERARLADAARVATPLATPVQVAALAAGIAEQAELYASGGVAASAAGAFRSRMVGNVQTLARWLGMSEPMELASYASPYGGDPVRAAWAARAGVQMPLCRLPSSRWTTYGATCNTPLAADGTCPEQRLHV